MFFRSFVVFIFLCSIQLSYAQEVALPVVDSISIEGLKRTKENYLQRFLQDLMGQEASLDNVKAQVQNLRNVPGITDATYLIQKHNTDDKASVTFYIVEQRTQLPVFNFGSVKGNNFIVIGGYDVNWRGRGELLSAQYQRTDGRNGGQFYYRVPFIRSSNWGYSTSLVRLASREPLYFEEGEVTYLYDNNSVALALIRNFELTRSFRSKEYRGRGNLEIGATFFQEKYKKYADQVLETPPGPDNFKQNKILFKTQYYEDHLNRHFFYIKGADLQVRIQNVYNTVDKDWFNSIEFQGRRFYRFNKVNLAFRFRLAIATNKDSPFAPFVVDSHINLRGSGNRIDRGTAQVIFNAEHRHTIFATADNNWGLQLVAFTDVGTWRRPGNKLEDFFSTNIVRQYLGGGFRVICQKVYSAILRVDYGIDIFHREARGVVIGLGQYF